MDTEKQRLIAENNALRAALAYAIKEADGWYDDCHGGRIETPEMDAARRLVEPPANSA